MDENRHQDSKLIDLVGAERVKDRFDLSPQALHMWRVRGIPLAKRIAFSKLCAENAVPTPPDFFEKFAA